MRSTTTTLSLAAAAALGAAGLAPAAQDRFGIFGPPPIAPGGGWQAPGLGGPGPLGDPFAPLGPSPWGTPGGLGIGGFPGSPLGPSPASPGVSVNPFGPGPTGPGAGLFGLPPAIPGPGGLGLSQVVGLADLLAGQADEFLNAFVFDARKVPQGNLFLADATALRDSALRFRQAAASGAPPPVLGNEFRNVAASWQRLEGRMAVVSRGRIGPNIATALQMGRTVDQIGRSLP